MCLVVDDSVDSADGIVIALPMPMPNKGKKHKIKDSPPPMASTSQAQLPVTLVKRRLLRRDSLGSLSSLSPISPITTLITTLLPSTTGSGIKCLSTPSWDSMTTTPTIHTSASLDPFDLPATKSPQAVPALAVAGSSQGQGRLC